MDACIETLEIRRSELVEKLCDVEREASKVRQEIERLTEEIIAESRFRHGQG